MERQVAVTLAPSSNLQTLNNLGLAFERGPGFFGLAPQIEAIGALAPGPGSFDIRINGSGTVRGSVSEFREYELLPVLVEDLVRFFRASETLASALGAIGDAGGGNDRMRVNGSLSVIAEATLRLVDFDADGLQGLAAFWVDPLSGGPTAGARGLASPSGNNILENAGTLSATATAQADRLDLLFASVSFGDRPQVTVSTANATAMAGGGGNDRLTNLAAGELSATADAQVRALGVAVTGLTILSAENASQAIATAIGMAGGDGHDVLENEAGATIDVVAMATTEEGELSISLIDIGLPEVVLEVKEEETLAQAVAVGMSGGAGNDLLTNAGTLKLTSTARQEKLAIAIEDAGIDTGAIVFIIDGRPPASELPDQRPEAGARADLTGIAGGDGSDTLHNSGSIEGTASANARLVDIAISVPFNDLAAAGPTSPTSILGAFGLGLTDLSTDSSAFVRAMDGGSGSNRLTNSGSIELTGAADSRTTGINFDLSSAIPAKGGAPFSVAFDIYNLGANSFSEVIGLAGGASNDTLLNAEGATLDLTATAFSLGTFVDFRVAYSSDPSLDISGSALLARLVAGTDAVGLDGGTGLDRLDNEGAITISSRATTRTADVTLEGQLTKGGAIVSAPIIDTGMLADARATGLRSDDLIAAASSTGTLDITADARVASVSVGIGIAANSSGGLSGSGRLVNAEQVARATATGIERRAPADGSDQVNISLPQPVVLGGRADVLANAVASRVGVAGDLGIASSGVGLGIPVLFAENRAESSAALLRGSARDSLLSTSGALTSRAETTATSVTVAVGLGGASNGVGFGGAVMLGDTGAKAEASLFDTGAGRDVIFHDADAASTARATARSTGVGVTGSYATNGVAAGVSVMQLGTNATARAGGALLGAGDDHLEGAGRISADAESESILNGIGVSIDFAVNGVGFGAAFGDISPVATADATAVDMGDGDDVLLLSAPVGPAAPGFLPHSLHARANTLARGVGVNVGLAGSYQGVGVGGAVLLQESIATSMALGATGGAGNDLMSIDGTILVDSRSLARSTGVSVGIGFAVYGFSVGATAILSDVLSEATGTGLASGGGASTLLAGRALTVDSHAEAFRESVAVSLSGGIGVGLAFNWVQSNTTATATATGLDGHDGDAELVTAGVTRVTADSFARGTTVGVSGTLGISGNLFDGTLTSDAHATGQFGGTGSDLLRNLGPMTVTGIATVGAPSVSVSLLGANVGSFTNSATAAATGLDGGSGNDTLWNAAALNSNATATVSSVTVAVSTGGGNVGDLSNSSDATARGLSGGGGSDVIGSTGRIEARATATATSTGVSYAGVFNADSADNEAVARAIGIEGDAAESVDAGDDIVEAFAPVIANAVANARGTAVAVSGTFPVGGNLLSMETNALAEAVGIAGRAGNDLLGAFSLVEAISNVSVRGPSVQVSLSGVSGNIGSFDRVATALSTGISGGSGSDIITSSGIVRATSTADARGLAVSVGVSGFSMTALSTKADATSIGIDAGRGLAGNNLVNASGRIDSVATATAPQTSVAVNLVGASLPESRAGANARAIAIAGGDGADSILATAPLSANANADVRGVTVSVSLAGASLPDARAQAEATASGVDGGGGNNTVLISNALSANAVANTRSTTVGVTLAGAAITDAGTVSVANAAGYRGGGGFDQVEIGGAGTVTANAMARADSAAVSLAGTSLAKLSADATANATLARSTSGGSDIRVSRAGLVQATASATGVSTNLTLAGFAGSSTDRIASATAVGLSGGHGDDRLATTARLDIEARATVQAGARNIGFVAGTTGSGNAAVESLATSTGMHGGDGRNFLNWQAPMRVFS
ncbi:MAG: beta strand repeat-containing protein, partial [Thermaurantiacus sp.]